MTAMFIVQSSAFTPLDYVLLSLVTVIMLPILATWIVATYRACSDRLRRLFGGVAVALAIGGILPLFYYPCYWFMVECWLL